MTDSKLTAAPFFCTGTGVQVTDTGLSIIEHSFSVEGEEKQTICRVVVEPDHLRQIHRMIGQALKEATTPASR